MTAQRLPAWTTSEALEPLRGVKRQSFVRLAVTESLMVFGAVTAVAALVGITGNLRETMIMLAFAGSWLAIGALGHKSFERAVRPPTTRVLSSLVAAWVSMVIAGMALYLATGTITSVDAALLESASGFSTTAITTLDPSELGSAMQVWRASTQWMGGLLGLLIGVIALPQALRSSSLLGRAIATDESRLVTRPTRGRLLIMRVYGGFTVAMIVAYLATGLSPVDAAVHGLTTVSTGGFSSRADSFAGFGTATRVVSTIGMIIAGSSFSVIWWALRGRLKPLRRSSELRIYVAVLVITTGLLAFPASSLSITDAAFTAASTVSTTGYAAGQWTLLPDSYLAVLLVVVAMGSMAGSAGGGLRVLRVHTLMKSVLRELRLQLDPNRVAVIKNSGRPVEEASIDRISGYHIAHIFVCAAGAFVISISGIGLVESLWIAVGTLSSFGPAPGIGSYGNVAGMEPWVRLTLIPMMLAARLSVLVVLLGLVHIGGAKKSVGAAVRRRLRAVQQ